jgi:Flp pilus assembly CpaF family ATPase
LLAELTGEERLLIIEDTRELQVAAPNFVSLEANPHWGIGLRDLVRLALRFRPDRIIVGEVRGGEAFDLLQALSTGHDGGIGTLHASDAPATLARLEQLVLQSGVQWSYEAIRQQVAATFHYVAHLARRNGHRFVREVIALSGYVDGRYQTRSLFRAVP